MDDGDLVGISVVLRVLGNEHVAELIRIRQTPEVFERWVGEDVEREVREAVTDDETHAFAILDRSEQVVGMIQFHEDDDPMYRHAGIDIFVDPARQGEGLGTDAMRTLVRHLFDDLGHHRLTIDPAADNTPAIHVYAKVGFQPVGVMRQYEQGADGTFHDGLLMDLLVDDWRSMGDSAD